MKITNFETFLANAGLRNYLFIRLTTDNGIQGIGEASLEWQEKTVETICHEWVKDQIIEKDPFDIEAVVGGMIRDQYQGGSTVLTAISGTEIAMWDIIGKACNQPVYKLLGGRCKEKIPAYANGWYGGSRTPKEYSECAKEAIRRGYRGVKFDPFGTAWKTLSEDEIDEAIALVAAVREAIGSKNKLMIEFHGRLSTSTATQMCRYFEEFQPAWCEEPVAPERVDLLAEVKRNVKVPISSGERLYTIADFQHLFSLRAVDIVQMDISHCGGLLVSKKIAAMADAQDIQVSPHCSVGPVALAAALHFDLSTPNFMIQETFSDFDVPWRSRLVNGWNPIENGEFTIPDKPGLGLTINEDFIKEHPYVKNAFPGLWDKNWMKHFTQDEKKNEKG
jgi:galactonate dehydratase